MYLLKKVVFQATFCGILDVLSCVENLGISFTLNVSRSFSYLSFKYNELKLSQKEENNKLLKLQLFLHFSNGNSFKIHGGWEIQFEGKQF